MADLMEGLYGWAVRVAKRAVGSKLAKNSNEVLLSQVRKRVQVLASAICQQPIEVRESDDEGTFFKDVLYLPSKIDCFSNPELNTLVYLHRAVCMNRETLEGLPHFNEFFSKLYTAWDLLSVKNQNLLWGNVPTDFAQKDFNPEKIKGGKSHAGQKNELIQKTLRRPKTITLKKVEENPLVHSFEKVETIEDYQHGNKHLDGEDELTSHAEALNELTLSHVIRTANDSKGLLKSDGLIELESERENEKTEISPEAKLYPEWFYREQRYRKDWCAVFETPVKIDSKCEVPPQVSFKFLDLALVYLKNRRSIVKNQISGTEIDIDAWVKWKVNPALDQVLEPPVYTRPRKKLKSVSVSILLDTSLSTEGWIANQQILGLLKHQTDGLSHSLKNSEISFSVHAFFTETRHRCFYSPIKEFSDDWGSLERQKLYALSPQGYTRMGPILRHASFQAKKASEKTKIILLLTDSKPTDFDPYEGQHGVYDVRRAIIDAKSQGVHAHCISLKDKQNTELRQMYGETHYDRVGTLSDFEKSVFRLIQGLVR